MKLLIAIDDSPVSATMVDEVANRPWPSGTIACVLHIIDWPQLPSYAPLIQKVKQSVDVLVTSAAAKLGNAGLRTRTRMLEGHPRVAIAEYAKEWGADLVLVGTHGASGLARFLLGSVAQAALRKSPCSVELVRRPAEGSVTTSTAMKILVATDGSDCSMGAVRSVAQRPWPTRSQIRVISVVPLVVTCEMRGPTFSPVYPPPEIIEALQKDVRVLAEEAVASARKVLCEAGITAIDTDSMPMGDARQVILEQAKDWGADLIVVGSHGYHGIDRLMLGSVSESVATHAHCSVEVIRESRFPISKELS